MDMSKIDDIIWKETQQAAYEEQCLDTQSNVEEE